GVRVNDDHTFDILYRYLPDGAVYSAHFTYAADLPFEDFESVDLVKYEVAPANLPQQTSAAFRAQHPDATIKAVIADHDADGAKPMGLAQGDEQPAGGDAGAQQERAGQSDAADVGDSRCIGGHRRPAGRRPSPQTAFHRDPCGFAIRARPTRSAHRRRGGIRR